VPRGTTHELVNLGLLGAAALAWHALGGDRGPYQDLAEGFAAGYLAGTFLITPDLDLAEHPTSRPRAMRRWGPLAWIWLPYGALFRHRGLSHTWLAGPLSRLLYLYLVLQGLLYGVGLLGARIDRLPGLVGRLQRWLSGPGALAAAAGYLVAQWLHLLLDGIPIPLTQRRPSRARGRRR